jgi:putative flippase GtrA
MKTPKIKLDKRTIIEFVKSNIAGNSMFVTTYITYFVCDSLLGVSVELSLLYATIMGNTLGVLLNFLIQKFWVFKPGQKSTTTIQVGRYVVFMIMNAAINYGIILGLETYLHITPYIGQFIAGYFFIGWNYFWYKLWIFKRVKGSGSTKAKQKAA